MANDANRGMATISAMQAIQKNRFNNIALSSGRDSWEYPLWILTRENGLDGPRIEHIDVENVSGAIQRPQFKADIVVAITDDGNITLREPGN
jgi:hypothetical protein